MRRNQWRNRIVGQEIVPIGNILPNVLNWRKHPESQQTYVKGSLDNLGWIRSVLVNLRTSEEWEIPDRNKKTIIDGHLRLDLALKNGEKKIPVEYVDLSPEEERIALATLDPMAALAETDENQLKILLSSIDSDIPMFDDILKHELPVDFDELLSESDLSSTIRHPAWVVIRIPIEKIDRVEKIISTLKGAHIERSYSTTGKFIP
jgi:hypothetical protein